MQKFLNELSELTLKHNIVICSAHGFMDLFDYDNNIEIADQMTWSPIHQKYVARELENNNA